jgi:tRNA(Ile)-lysidine synthase
VQLAGARADICDLAHTAAEVLERRLSRTPARPLAVALSGGGDSVALLLVAETWARDAGRPLLVLTVDHGLQPESAVWTAQCAARAQALGVSFRALRWAGEKPAHGLPAAAREARHRLLAEAAREAGAGVILLGHTADDIGEARAMRRAGSSTPEPREWGPSPAWPEGRGVFLLRPLLGLRRAEIRRWLDARGETWIEDPANADPRYARARARRDLAAEPGASAPREPPQPRDLARACRMDTAGVLAIEREGLRTAAPDDAAAFVAMACLCAAGTRRPPSAERVHRLVARLTAEGNLAATLAGARIEAEGREVRFLREPGETARGGLKPLRIAPGGVWDGRFEIAADGPLEVRALAGLAGRLGKADRAALQAFTPKARAGLPAAIDAGGAPCLLQDIRPLALERLRAACGLVEREPD